MAQQPGTKIILFCDGALVSILRDDIPNIPFPNHWDLPGGGIEAGETPTEAVLREVREEIGLTLDPATFVWSRRYPPAATFYAAPVSPAQIKAIRLGDEGQSWRMMPVAAFCTAPDAVPHFRDRVRDFWSERR